MEEIVEVKEIFLYFPDGIKVPRKLVNYVGTYKDSNDKLCFDDFKVQVHDGIEHDNMIAVIEHLCECIKINENNENK